MHLYCSLPEGGFIVQRLFLSKAPLAISSERFCEVWPIWAAKVTPTSLDAGREEGLDPPPSGHEGDCAEGDNADSLLLLDLTEEGLCAISPASSSLASTVLSATLAALL